MSISNDQVVRTMRHMAWQRAKAELASVLCTFWPAMDESDKFKELDDKVNEFIAHVEDHGLQE